jgi:hypothetical protein
VIYNHATFLSDTMGKTGSQMKAMGVRPKGAGAVFESNSSTTKARPQAGFFIMGQTGSFKETN